MRFLKSVFELDLRSLALYRVGIATMVLVDLFHRSFNLRAHYSDFGIFPTELAGKSFHCMNGQAWFAGLMFALHALFALGMLLGIRTRISTFATWIMMCSLHSRNFVIIDCGDDVIRVMLMASILLPLGAYYSIDSALSSRKIEEKTTVGFNTFHFVAQLCLVYWISILFKNGPEWRETFSATYMALQIDIFTTRLGIFIGRFYELTKFMTVGALAVEMVGPVLAIMPYKKKYFRPLGIFLMLSLHIGFALTMELGIFPFICAICWLALLPSEMWDAMTAKVQSNLKKVQTVTVFFDGDCGFCLKMVRILRVLLFLGPVEIRKAQTDPDIEKKMQAHDSWVVKTPEGNYYYQFDGLAVAMRQSPVCAVRWLARLLSVFPFKDVGNFFYEAVSSIRPLLGRITERFKVHGTVNLIPGKPSQFVSLWLSICVIWYNLYTVDLVKFPQIMKEFVWIVRFDQKWNMFSPMPLTHDGWWVTPGKTVSGKEVNVLYPDEPVTFERPELISKTYIDQRWRKYLMNLSSDSYDGHLPYFSRWLCRRYNTGLKNQADKLESFELIFMYEITQPYPEKPVLIPEIRWSHNCFKESDKEDLSADH